MSQFASPPPRAICLIGPLPPKRGGISIYVQRLASRLVDLGVRVVVASTNGGDDVRPEVRVYSVRTGRGLVPEVARIALLESIDLLHFHTFGGGWREMAPWSVFRQITGIPVVLSQHSFRQDIRSLSRHDQWMTGRCVNTLSRTVTSGREVRDKLLALGASPQRVLALTPFIRPSSSNQSSPPFPPEIQALIDCSSPLIVGGTGRLVAYEGRDLYGLDVFVRAAQRTLKRLPNAGFVFLIADPGDEELLADAQDFIKRHHLQDRVCVYLGAFPAPLLWAAGDIYIRPTIDDGDAISIHEAMFLGVPAIASDAVKRPKGCRTYRNGDADDCSDVIIDVAHNLSRSREFVAHHRPAEAVDELIEVYRDASRPLRARAASALSRVGELLARRRRDRVDPTS